ncbi:MAG: TonB-dependent receptor, partial [Bacteroidetes bacterium HGW-Bacteroidetes-22]
LLSNGKAEFNLFRRSYPLEEAVIIGERTDRNVTRAQLGVFNMEARTIRAIAGTFGETDIIRGATLLPGIQSPGEFGSGFIVRGGSVDQNLILVEGVPLFNSSHLFGLSAAINPDAISEMTIYKTSIPARYGERIASVMDIKLGMENTKKFNLQGGIGVLNSRLSAFIPLYNDKVSLMVSGRGSYSDWILHQIPSLELKQSSAGFYDLNAMSTIKYSATGKISTFGYLSYDDFSLNGMTDYHYENRLASLRWDFLLSKKLSAGIMGGISDYHLRVIDSDDSHPEEASRINLSTNYNTLKIGLNWFPNSDHTVRFGLDGILYRNQPGNLQREGIASHIVPTELQPEKGLELAAYLSDDFAITPLLAIEAGIRVVNFRSLGPGSVFIYKPGLPMTVESISDTLYYGENDKVASYSGIEPRLSLRYILNETSSIKLGYNRMNQFINLISNSSVVSPTDAWKLSSYYLKPTVSNQVSLGYFKNFLKNTIETSIEVYYKKMDNVTEYKNGAKVLLNQHLETDLTAAQGYSYGVELLIRKNAGKLSGWISYTYSRSMHRTSETMTSGQINGNSWFPSNFDVPHNLVVNINYQPSRRWRFTGTFYFSTGRPLTLPELQYTSAGEQLVWYSDRNEYRLPAFHRLDLSITFDKSLRIKKRWKGNWTFSIINVYGRKNAYSVFYSRENPQNWNYTGSYNLSKMYILGAPLPTLTYNFSL